MSEEENYSGGYARRTLERKREILQSTYNRAIAEDLPVDYGRIFAAIEDLDVALNVLRAHYEKSEKQDRDAQAALTKRRKRDVKLAAETVTSAQTPMAKRKRGRPPKQRSLEEVIPPADTEPPPPPSGAVETFGELSMNGGAP